MPIPTNNNSDDAALIRAVQDGDTRAFEPLVERHIDSVRAFIALRLPVTHLVNELTHETFVFAFRRLADFEAGTSFRAWLRAIAGNLIRAELQHFRREQANRLGYAQFQVLETELAAAERQPPRETELLLECIGELPAAMRELLADKYREDRTAAQIGARLQRTEAWVWQTLFRLRQQLRACIEGKLTAEGS